MKLREDRDGSAEAEPNLLLVTNDNQVFLINEAVTFISEPREILTEVKRPEELIMSFR